MMQENKDSKAVRMEERIKGAGELSGRLGQMLMEAGEIGRYGWDSNGKTRSRIFSEKLLEAAELSDRLNANLRELMADAMTDRQVYGRYLKDMPCLCRVEVQYRKKVLEVCLPALLPHRKQPYAQFLERPLSLALQEWCRMQREEGKALPRFGQAVLCFEHCYTAGCVRDHDNVEAKQIQDLLSLFFLEGDDGMHLDLYHTSRQDVKNRTKLFLMEKEHFPEWIMERIW